MSVIIVGGGIAGLALALSLHQAGVRSRVYEAASAFRHVGVGLNLMPHAMRELTELGLLAKIEALGVPTREMAFYNRFGQFIHAEPRGRHAGYDWPQISIHRAHIHAVLAAAVRERLGDDAIVLDHRCEALEQDDAGVTVRFRDRPSVRGAIAIGADGIHSVFRKQFFPNEGPPVYKGINMWRGTTRWTPFLSGQSMVQVGWIDVGKMVIYPLEREPGPDGRQLINWVAERRSPRIVRQDWNVEGRLDDLRPTYGGWSFDWLDVAGMIEHAEQILEYPMVDRDPIPTWTFGRATLAGDAAHPMYPRGGNGAGQGILDARTLAGCIRREGASPAALASYDAVRTKAANDVVLLNRTAPPDAILGIVHERTGDKPFARIEDVVSREELEAVMRRYKEVAGMEKESLRSRASLV